MSDKRPASKTYKESQYKSKEKADNFIFKTDERLEQVLLIKYPNG